MTRLRLVLVALLLLTGCSEDPDPAPSTGCNGHEELCDRRYDEVAYAATHNSMSAASEPGWFTPDQPDGIVDQLDHGIRVLLIDSWYGQRTSRRGIVATADSQRQAAFDEARETYGDRVVDLALRARRAAGLDPQGEVRPYLCHAMCELGSTRWLDSLRDVRDWIETHPREVVTLFVQDEVSPRDTAEVVERAGLLPYVHEPAADGRWPALGEMVASGRRLVILMENHGGGERWPWLIDGFSVVQDTPYLFKRPEDFTCETNRGDAGASLLLVNHWIDDWRHVPRNSEIVNARDVLAPRLEECREERGMLPNFVAVDYYDRGDLLAVVDELNGVG